MPKPKPAPQRHTMVIDSELYQRLRRAAAGMEHSISEEIRRRLTRSFAIDGLLRTYDDEHLIHQLAASLQQTDVTIFGHNGQTVFYTGGSAVPLAEARRKAGEIEPPRFGESIPLDSTLFESGPQGDYLQRLLDLAVRFIPHIYRKWLANEWTSSPAEALVVAATRAHAAGAQLDWQSFPVPVWDKAWELVEGQLNLEAPNGYKFGPKSDDPQHPDAILYGYWNQEF